MNRNTFRNGEWLIEIYAVTPAMIEKSAEIHRLREESRARSRRWYAAQRKAA